jgi:hypothetical protein
MTMTIADSLRALKQDLSFVKNRLELRKRAETLKREKGTEQSLRKLHRALRLHSALEIITETLGGEVSDVK